MNKLTLYNALGDKTGDVEAVERAKDDGLYEWYLNGEWGYF